MQLLSDAPAGPGAFKPKLIIWDLDDTLWQGTLAEGHNVILDERRAAFVRTLNGRGIVSAICSKNDLATARATLERFGLWDDFVFPRIAFVPKGPAVKQLIADMQLRAVNVLFIDDNPHNLHEVAHAVPGIQVMDATSAACDALLQRIADDHAHVSKSRVDDYKILETRLGERAQHAELSDEAFLVQSEIHATCVVRADNLLFVERIEELINRSNQLNYTESRVEPGSLAQQIADVMRYDTLCVFVWDKYGYYGLVGVSICERESRNLLHFAFSCRIMHMGVEDYLLTRASWRLGDLDLSGLRKPLPSQSSRAITDAPFGDAAVRERILALDAPRDASKIELRVMADCQSGVIHHYSRLRDRMDFDNWPRLFSLPMLMSWNQTPQQFPPYLIYTAAMDYIEERWTGASIGFDYPNYIQCAESFCNMIVSGNRKLLVLLPPLDAPVELYRDRVAHRNEKHSFEWEFGEFGNDLWFSMAARYPDHIFCIDQTGLIAPEDMMDTNHYRPSVWQRVAGMVDGWYAQQIGAVADSVPAGADLRGVRMPIVCLCSRG